MTATTTATCTNPQDTYTYDATGNTTTRPGPDGTTQTLDWSPEGQLHQLTQGNKTTQYLYDAAGTLLIRRTTGGETVLYAGDTELHQRADGTTWAQRHYSNGSTTLAVRSNATGQQVLTYLISDHHGTATLAIAALGQAFTRRRHSPFGTERGTNATWPDDKGFLGKTLDTTTGVSHIGARHYDPTLGRFISVDPLMDPTDPDQMQGYTYANNNPITHSDPTGLFPVAPGGFIGIPGNVMKKKMSNAAASVTESTEDRDEAGETLDDILATGEPLSDEVYEELQYWWGYEGSQDFTLQDVLDYLGTGPAEPIDRFINVCEFLIGVAEAACQPETYFVQTEAGAVSWIFASPPDWAREVDEHLAAHWRDYGTAGVGIATAVGLGPCSTILGCAAVGASGAAGAYIVANAGTDNWNWTSGAIQAVGGAI
ncbi:RHS repeat-associated core domain-containing protein [Streptomyces sp. YIM 98790]|uniref:RHS repeat-associated core domain-containing protein n=1 Tax=Streptomyces sp. YIM 98790 TaxID=2689077 RepID=UPI0028BEE9E7|nr:RHS repeat-associated core domain-containing protein [Streptomyces sp. YIM 98790]